MVWIMRVISGTAKGRRLRAPRGWRVRPTADRVKESLFNLLRMDWETCRVMDLFAGSGALGIEALSRGALEALFVEEDPQCLSVIQQNLQGCGLTDRGRVLRSDVLRFLSGKKGHKGFGVTFADPPYDSGLALGCLERADRGGWVAPEGRMVVEHSRREVLPDRLTRLVLLDRRAYGDTRLSIYGFAGEMLEAVPRP
jgi:16S rRNA (guanine966-N2)-methyltransferase